MDRAEAIRVLRTMMLGVDIKEEIQALDLAIEALGEPSVSEKERVVDRARRKLGDKVTIPAVVEEIEHTILGEINYKVVPLNTWFDADEIEALGQTESEDCISADCIEVVILKNIPPFTPTERTGEWEETESKDRPHHLCIQELSKVCNDCKLYWRCPYLKKEFGGDDNE